MSRYRQYKRSVGVRFGERSVVQSFALSQGTVNPQQQGVAQSFSNLDDDGIRIRFDFNRTATGEPDSGKLQLYNLTEQAAKSIVQDYELLKAERVAAFQATVAADDATRAQTLDAINRGYRIQVFAGYVGNLELVFLGEYTSVKQRERVGFTDFITEIELGDTILSLRDSFVSQGLGPGVNLTQIIEQLSSSSALQTNEQSKLLIQAVAPTSVVSIANNGALGMVRTPEAIDEIADLLGLQWFVRNGELYFLTQGGVIPDYGLQLVEGRDLHANSQELSDSTYAGRANMNARIEPGRGIRVLDENLLPRNTNGYRVQTARYVGDTHSGDFYVDFTAEAALQPVPFVDADLLDPRIGI